MAAVRVESARDRADVVTAAGPYLLSDPVRHSIFLTMVEHQDPGGRFWWATDAGHDVIGFAMQAPAGFSGSVTPAAPEVVDALCDRMMADVPDLPGVIAEAPAAARFAGRWAERLAIAARPVECQRVYRLDEVTAARETAVGHLRPAHEGDRDTLVPWAAGFLAEVGGLPEEEPGAIIDLRLAAGSLWVWDDDGPATLASATPPLGGVCRIGFVYTPPERRRRGYATACVAALSQTLLDDGADACMLYAQLHNPTSNAIYRRMGYRSVGEIVSFRFG